jgi:hypothetical protein
MKVNNPRFEQFHQALHDSLNKIGKYYNQLDEKPVYVLALILHPYYKLAYIKMAWGGPEEQAAELANGNADAKDWHDEALKIVKRTMEEYWHKQQEALMLQNQTLASDYDGYVICRPIRDP